MRLTSVVRGQHFGQLAYIRGLITYRLSPFEQRAFAGFTSSIPNTLIRIKDNVLKIVPPFALGYLIYTQTEKEFVRINRKNPADFANDK